MAGKRFARVDDRCVACGSCVKVCPLGAISVWKGVVARVDKLRCVGCGKCAGECPAGSIELVEREAAV